MAVKKKAGARVHKSASTGKRGRAATGGSSVAGAARAADATGATGAIGTTGTTELASPDAGGASDPGYSLDVVNGVLAAIEASIAKYGDSRNAATVENSVYMALAYALGRVARGMDRLDSVRDDIEVLLEETTLTGHETRHETGSDSNATDSNAAPGSNTARAETSATTAG